MDIGSRLMAGQDQPFGLAGFNFNPHLNNLLGNSRIDFIMREKNELDK